MSNYKIILDQTAKDVLCELLLNHVVHYAKEVAQDANDANVQLHETYLQLYKGILYTKATDEDVND